MTWLMLPASKSGVAELPPLLWTSKVVVDDMTDLLYVLSRGRAREAEEGIVRKEGIRIYAARGRQQPGVDDLR
jgi:hypothetical protein